MRIGVNGLLKPARPRTCADIIGRPVSRDVHPSPLACFLKKHDISISYITAFGTASYRCPKRYEFPVERPPGRRLLSARLGKGGHRPPMPGLGVHREYSALGPASAVSGQDSCARVRHPKEYGESLNITCLQQPNGQSKVVFPNVYRESLLNKARQSPEPTTEQEFAPSLHLSSRRHSGDRRPDLVAG